MENDSAHLDVLSTRCCVVGGGPAGMVLGYLLARAGVDVVVLEKHADFLRDFRGDTVHPSTLQILDEMGLLEKFRGLDHQTVRELGVRIAGKLQPVADFRGLKPFDYLALVPQWDFLSLLASEGRELAQFDLRMRHEAVGLIRDGDRVTGVRVCTPKDEIAVHADLVVACDGRDSTLREAAGFKVREYGAPMDVLWFRLPRGHDAPDSIFGIVDAGRMMILLDRGEYWQAAFVVPKGSDTRMRAQPIGTLRDAVVRLAPFLSGAVDALQSWDNVKTLQVHVNRLQQWCRPGLLLIGDAAHAMSPVGGVGINLAIQDAVAAANILAPVWVAGKRVDTPLLHRVQKRRMLPAKLIQVLQLQVQKRLISKFLEDSSKAPRMPTLLRWLLRFRAIRHLPARLIGYGFRREHVRSGTNVRPD